MISKTALKALSTEIRNETSVHGNTKERVANMLDAIIDASLEDVTEITTTADIVNAAWAYHVIIAPETGANQVTVASTGSVALQSLIIIENYSPNACDIVLTDGEIRGTEPAGGWVIPSNGKVHLQLTGTGKISIVGV